MKQQSLSHMGRTSLGLSLAALVLALWNTPATAVTVPVDVGAPRYNLYVDPYNGNTVKLGGFSGIIPVPHRPDWVYVITDRGPGPDYKDPQGGEWKVSMLPGFGPQIITLHLHPSGTAKIAEIRPLKNPNPSAGLISGLPPTKPGGEVILDMNLNNVPIDEDGIDTEGLTLDCWGNFWVCDEYKPSIAMVNQNGKVMLRLVPAGTLAGTETLATYDVLPKVLAKRYVNRGLEGITFAEGVLYAIMQRPLMNPNKKASETNQNIRIVAVNLNAVLHGNPAAAVRQYIYRTEPTAKIGDQKKAYASDICAVSPTKFLVPERQTDKLYCFDLTGATDITGKEDEDGKLLVSPNPDKKTIEELTGAELAAIGVTPVAKTVVLPSLTAIDPVLAKCEGVCLIGQTIVLTQDNDFNLDWATDAPTPNPGGPLLQINLQPNNLPRLFLVPLPPGILP